MKMPAGNSMHKGPIRPKSIGKTAKRLFSYVAKYKKRFMLVLVCIILSAVAGVAGSLFLRILIDDYITPFIASVNPDFSGLLTAIFIMAGIYLAGVAASLIYNRLMVGISQGVLKKIRDEMFSKMQSLPVKYFDTHSRGDVMSRYTNDTDTLRQMISQSIPEVFSSVITVVTVFFAMLFTSVYLTLIMLAFVYVNFAVTKRLIKKSSIYFVKQQKSIGAVNGFIEEMINGQKVIKVFNHEEKSKEDFDKINGELCRDSVNANTYSNILMPVMANLGYLQYVIIAIAGGALAIFGISGITLGAIGAFLQLSRSFSRPLNMVSQQMNSVIMSLAGAERIFDLMDEKPETDEGYVTLVNAKYENGVLCETAENTGLWAWKHPHKDGTLTYAVLKGEVQFYDITFGYEENKTVLRNVSLCAKPGEKIAFVGATGAGKTTVTNLINRFYDIADGKIKYDGININKIKKDDLRRSLGIVLQDTNLFSGTVADNIRYGKLDASDEEVINAAKRANAHNFISMLPKGYDTELTANGSELSQGQRQLLSIARAEIADSPVMILDEATSSIDTRTEAIVKQGMESLMEGRTVFIIAHRLSTIKNCDSILLLDNGEITERGSHGELIALKGKYYQLYTGMFELE